MSELSTNPMRMALRAMTHGVYVLSVHHDGHDECLILSLAMQCSVEPPRVAFAISTHSRLLEILREARGGVLSVLDASQIAAVRRYGTPGGVRNAPVDAERSTKGHVIVPESACWLALANATEVSGGDHALFVADVIGAGSRAGPVEPLTLAASKFPYGG